MIYQAPAGHPKSITWYDANGEETKKVEFSQDGQEITETTDINHSPLGLRESDELASLFTIIKTTYKYDGVPPTALLISRHTPNVDLELAYPGAGEGSADNCTNPTSLTLTSQSVLGTTKTVTRYSNYVNDDMGNWISRTAVTTELYTDSEPERETRKIEYWDTPADSSGNAAMWNFYKAPESFIPAYSWATSLMGCVPFESMTYAQFCSQLTRHGIKYKPGAGKMNQVTINPGYKTFYVDKGKKSVNCSLSYLLSQTGALYGFHFLDKKEAMMIRDELLRIFRGSGVNMNKGNAKDYCWKEMYWGKVDGHTVWISVNNISSWSVTLHVFAKAWRQ